LKQKKKKKKKSSLMHDDAQINIKENIAAQIDI